MPPSCRGPGVGYGNVPKHHLIAVQLPLHLGEVRHALEEVYERGRWDACGVASTKVGWIVCARASGVVIWNEVSFWL
jgi:hypothetical protein